MMAVQPLRLNDPAEGFLLKILFFVKLFLAIEIS